jgi:hypothetical protein
MDRPGPSANLRRAPRFSGVRSGLEEPTQPFVMSVNNAGEGHSAQWWSDENPTLPAIYFDGDERPHVAPVGAPFVLYIVRHDAPSAVGGIGRVTGDPVRNSPGQWGTEVPAQLDLICAADDLAPSLSERGIDGSAGRPARRLDRDDYEHFVFAVATASAKQALRLAFDR